VSKKKGLLGPDGQPLDVEKYRRKPEPKPATVTVDGKDVSLVVDVGLDVGSWLSHFMFGGLSPTLGGPISPRSRLREAIEGQLAELHDELPDDWGKPHELEPVPPERTDTYAAAHTSAVRHCDHARSSHSTLYARSERQCDDCGRYFTKKNWWES
jgi:hypothetical protein